MTYAIVNHYDHGRKQMELACFTDLTSAKEFAKRCLTNHIVGLPEGDFIDVVEVPDGKTFAQGKAILRFDPKDAKHYIDLRM